MKKVLGKYGLEEIESVGKEFDVDLHEALTLVEDKNYPSNVVVQEHQKGYKLNGRVIRHAKVAVNK
jgi:molecular chaperone GrpE